MPLTRKRLPQSPILVLRFDAGRTVERRFGIDQPAFTANGSMPMRFVRRSFLAVAFLCLVQVTVAAEPAKQPLPHPSLTSDAIQNETGTTYRGIYTNGNRIGYQTVSLRKLEDLDAAR
jgi:hypothetical protein